MVQIATYDPRFFEGLRKAEKNHFWFQIRRKWIFDKVKNFIPPPAKILEIGCGAGNVSSFLAQSGYVVIGCEFYPEAVEKSWPGFQMVRGDTKDLPFQDNSFDIVGLFDVIEHVQDDIASLKEAARVVRKGGIIAVTAPAREELWSWVDEISFHKRRYTKRMLNRVLLKAGLYSLLTEYMFMSLYIPMRYIRRENKKINDHFKISGFLNILLKGIFNVERLISKGLPLPIGTSLIAVAQKNHTH